LDGLHDHASTPPLFEARAALSAVVYAALCALADEMQTIALAAKAKSSAQATGGPSPPGRSSVDATGAPKAPGAIEQPGGEADATQLHDEVMDTVGELHSGAALGRASHDQFAALFENVDFHLDVDWVGTAAVELPAATLCAAKRMAAPPEPSIEQKRMVPTLSGKSTALIPSPFSPPATPRADSAQAASQWAGRLAPSQRRPSKPVAEAAAQQEAAAFREQLTLSVKELLLGLAIKIEQQVRGALAARGTHCALPTPPLKPRPGACLFDRPMPPKRRAAAHVLERLIDLRAQTPARLLCAGAGAQPAQPAAAARQSDALAAGTALQ
jgi:hypothetical protein